MTRPSTQPSKHWPHANHEVPMSTATLRIAAVQLKFRRSVPENTALICRFIAQAARLGSDVVLFPECALTGYNVDFRQLSPATVANGLQTVAAAARQHRCHV